ncbi:putative holin-like toxin [Clostridium perfringens]|nr:putative holin-like toxin [Clostridium perfringens]
MVKLIRFKIVRATGITHPYRKGVIHMSNDNLMLLFTGGMFLLALLTFIVLLIEKISKK